MTIGHQANRGIEAAGDRMVNVVPVLLSLVLSLFVAPTLAAAKTVPAHCERARGEHVWPVSGDPQGGAPADAIPIAVARARVATLRRQWHRVTIGSGVLRSFTECLMASSEHFVVRRVSSDHARAQLEGVRRQFPANVLLGDPGALPAGWLWEVYWGGASRRHPPSGALSGYLSADGRRLIAVVHWPEG